MIAPSPSADTATSAPDLPPAGPDLERLRCPRPKQTDRCTANAKGIRVALMTPWDQECGNAEYAKRLAVGLNQFATISPHEMVNLGDPDLELKRFRRRRICRSQVREVNRSGADLIHIQHEFCFFGRGIREANRNFRHAMRRLRKPVVVTLHTWPWSKPTGRRRLTRFFGQVRERLSKRHFVRSLRRANAIVVHSTDTYQKIIGDFPRLKKKLFVVPIQVEPIDSAGVAPPLRKRPGERWIVLPGFVSRYKGHSHAIASLPHLPADYRLVIAGGVHPKDKTGNGYWMQLLTEADALGVQNRVLFTGFLTDPQQQAALLRQADCFLLPYDEVGQSGSAVLADSLSYFKPVITSTAKSMYVYRGIRDTAYSSVSVDVSASEVLANTITQCVDPDASGVPPMRHHQQAVYDCFSRDQTQHRYQRVYAFALS